MSVGVFAVVGAVGWVLFRRNCDPATTQADRAPDEGKVGSWPFLALVVVGYLGLIAIGVLIPPWGWDTLVYHLTVVFHASASGSLERVAVPMQQFWFPQVGELHALWAYLLGGAGEQSWRITGIALAPLNLTAGLAVVVAAQALGLRAGRTWILAAMMLTPIVLIQPTSGYVDVAFAAYCLAAFAFALLAARDGQVAHLVLCTLASGLALGTKLSFLYLGLPVVVVLMTRRVATSFLAVGGARLAGRGVLLILSFCLGWIWWLGPNLLETGNPLYPAELRLGDTVLLHGPQPLERSVRQEEWFVDSSAGWWRYPFLETQGGRPAYTLENGFGPLFAAGLTATLVMLAVALRRRDALLFRALSALPLTLALWFLLSPYREPRYVIAAVGLALLGLAALMDEIRQRGIVPFRVTQGAVLIGMIFGASAGLVSVPHSEAAIASATRGDWSPTRLYELEYGSAGRAFNWIAEHSDPPKTIGFTNPMFIAPLYGWSGSNRPIYLPGSEDLPADGFQKLRTYRQLRRRLLEAQVDWLIIWRAWWEGEAPRRTERWVEDHDEDFESVADFDGKVEILRPIWTPEELELLRAPVDPYDLSRLDDRAAWVIEHTQGARARLLEAQPGGLSILYGLTREVADYVDLRADLDTGDWSEVDELSFELEVEGTIPILLFVYLKNPDPREHCRFRLETETLGRGPQRVSFVLREPESKTENFDRSRVAEVHLVLDDAEDADRGEGSIRVRGFELGHDDGGSR
jgi:hypothetical protein